MTDLSIQLTRPKSIQSHVHARSPLPAEVVHKVLEQSSQPVLAVCMRVSRDHNSLARRHLYSHPSIDPARLVQCLKVQHRSRPPTPSSPLPLGALDSKARDDVDTTDDSASLSTPRIPSLRDNLCLVHHLHLISLPFPPDPEPLPTPHKPRSKAQIIRRSIEVLTDFELHALAGPSDQGYRGLFPNLQTLTLGITGRDVMLRDDLPGGSARLRCTQDRRVGLCGIDTDAERLGSGLGARIAREGSSGLCPTGPNGAAAAASRPSQSVQDQGAHNEIQRIRMSILGQKDAVIGALQKLIAVIEPPVMYATQDSVYELPREGLRIGSEGYRGGVV